MQGKDGIREAKQSTEELQVEPRGLDQNPFNLGPAPTHEQSIIRVILQALYNSQTILVGSIPNLFQKPTAWVIRAVACLFSLLEISGDLAVAF